MSKALARQSAELVSPAVWQKYLVEMSNALERAGTVRDCLDISNKAEALRVLLERSGALEDDINTITELKVLCDHRAGSMLHSMTKARPGRKRNGSTAEPIPTLASLGIPKTTAYRLQCIAELPETMVRQELARIKAEKRMIVAAYFARLGLEQRKKLHRQEKSASVAHIDARILVGDFRKVLHIPDESVSLLFTDPPYDKESLPLYAEVARLAGRVLVPGGSLVCYAGAYYFPEVLDQLRMEPKLTYYWTLILASNRGGTIGAGQLGSPRGRLITNRCRFRLWFVKGKSRHTERVCDLVRATESAENDDHDWKSCTTDAEYLIDKLTVEGELVLDPMCGSGTMLAAAKKLGRRYLGCEIDPNSAKIASANLNIIS